MLPGTRIEPPNQKRISYFEGISIRVVCERTKISANTNYTPMPRLKVSIFSLLVAVAEIYIDTATPSPPLEPTKIHCIS